MDIVDSIKEAQAKRGWTDGELSRQIGMDGSEWSRIKSRQRTMGLRFIRAIARVFPELQVKLMQYVFEGDK